MYETINEELKRRFYGNSDLADVIKKTEKEVTEGKISPYAAAQKLFDNF